MKNLENDSPLPIPHPLFLPPKTTPIRILPHLLPTYGKPQKQESKLKIQQLIQREFNLNLQLRIQASQLNQEWE